MSVNKATNLESESKICDNNKIRSKKVISLNEKMIKKMMKKAYNYMVLLRKQLKNL